MSDLIDRQAALDALDEIEAEVADGFGFEYEKWRKYFCDLPPAQPKRIKGHWIDAVIPNDNGGLPVQVCDQCNTFFPLAYTGGGHSFCPHCDADMREVTE